MTKSNVLRAILAGGVCALALAGSASAQVRSFDLPAGDLKTALDAYSRQAGVQLIYRADDVGNRRSVAVKGAIDAKDALRRLLAGTGLDIQRDTSGAVAIVPQPASGAAPASEKPQVVEEVVVTGSRLAGPAVTPVVSIDAGKIASVGATNISQALNYLPQVTFSANANFYGGQQSVQLRGLDAGATLILVDGQRVVTSGVAAQSNYFDVNSLPMALVDRIEVLANSASAIYGADAVGGVVNVILKRHVAAPEASLYYGAAQGGGVERRATLTLPVERGRLSGGVSLEYYKEGGLGADKRAITANQNYALYGGTDLRTTNSNPATICSVSGGNLPGLSASCAAVPTGSTGVGLTPASFLATQGVQRRTSAASYGDILQPAERFGLTTNLTYAVNDNVDLTFEGFASHRTDKVFTSPTGMVLTVPANNPFNPFGVAVTARYLLTGLGPQESRYESRTIRPVLGLKVRNHGWTYDLNVSGFSDDGVWTLPNLVNAAAVTAAVNSTDPSTALNVFQDGPGGSPSLLKSLTNPLRLTAKSQAVQANAVARGALFTLPAGDLQVALGGEWRDERMALDYSALGFRISSDQANRRSVAAFGEARIPLISSDMGVALVRELTATAAARWDHYSDFGGKLNPQVGLLWRPVDRITVRGSYSTSFRAPSLYTLYQPATTQSATLTDPLRNYETYSGNAISGGNPKLKPEQGKSHSFGIEARPFAGLTISADYWSIALSERFAQLSPLVILANESSFPGRVVRAAPTAADVAAGLPGRVVSIESTPVNFGDLKTDGLDLAVHKTATFGASTVGLDLSATRVFDFKTRTIPGSPLADIVGLSSTQGTIPKWRGTAGVTWASGPYAAQAIMRYYSEVADTLNAVPTGREIPARTPVDLQVSVDLGQFRHWPTATAATKLRVGVINALNEGQTYSSVWGFIGYDPTNSDFRGRFTYVSLTQSF